MSKIEDFRPGIRYSSRNGTYEVTRLFEQSGARLVSWRKLNSQENGLCTISQFAQRVEKHVDPTLDEADHFTRYGVDLLTGDRWSGLSQAEYAYIAEEYSDQFMPEEAGYHDPYQADWFFVMKYPVHELVATFPENEEEDAYGTCQKWFENECAMAAESGREGQYNDLIEEDIQDPIVLIEKNGGVYVWDGMHRIGAAATRGLQYLKAIVGHPTPEPSPRTSLSSRQP